MGWWFAIALVLGTGLMLGLRVLAKRSFLKKRTPLSLKDLHAPIKDRVSFSAFSEVWTAVGNAYGIDPRLIQPTDTFAELNKADSWILGKGEDELIEWIDKRGAKEPPPLQTVLDLATWVDRSVG